MQKIIIIGGRGSGTVIAEAIKDAEKKGATDLHVEGFLHNVDNPGEVIDGTLVLGLYSKEKVLDYYNKGYKFIYSLHRIGGEEYMINQFYNLGLKREMLATFIHPTAFVSGNVHIEEGSVVMPYVMITSGAHVGMNTLIMAGATLGHNSTTGDFTHIASQAVVGSFISLGKGSNVGLNATILERKSIGEYGVLGMGSVLTKDIPAREIWVGNPAKFLKIAE